MTAVLSAAAMALTMMSGAAAAEAVEESVTEAVSEGVSEAAEEVPAQYPWNNPNIVGEVTEDTTADLKDDFYLAVNQEWLATTELKPGYVNAGSFNDRQDEVDEQIMSMLTDKSLDSHDARILQGLYDLFLDWDSRDEVGMSYLQPHVDALKAVSSIDELTEFLLSEEGLYYANAFNVFGLGYDSSNSSNYDLEILTIPLSLGDAAEYTELTQNGQIMQWFHETLVDMMLTKVGYTEEEAQDLLAKSFSFETAIAAYMMTTEEQNSSDAVQLMDNPRTFEELEEASPNFPLTQMMTAYDQADWNKNNLNEPKWLEGMNELYTEDHLEEMKAYLMCRLVRKSAATSDEETFRSYEEIVNMANGITESDTDEKYAYSYASGTLPTSVSKVYVEKYVTEETREDIREIITEVIDTYRDMLAEEDWLSDETREKAISKLDHITINAAYPDKWDDTDKIDFKLKEDGGTLSEAVDAIMRYSQQELLDRKNTQIDTEIWDFGVTDCNAYYNPMDNSINIIAGILGSPFYSEDMTEEQKLGAIGIVIGHEISHAFDTTGAQFDENGNLSSWWTDEDYAAFMERAQKLIDYYDQLIVMPDGTGYSGTMVQGEAIADITGLKCMLRIAEGIEDFDYDAFFRAFAEVWRSMYTREVELMVASQDEHPLDYLRVNVSVMQFPEFYETYGVAEGDGMYMAPEDRITVW